MHQSCERLYCMHLSERRGLHCLRAFLKGRPCVTPTARTEEQGREREKQR